MKDNYFAIEIDKIIEVIPLVRIEHVIDANPKLSGLINYRGDLIPIIDLKFFLYQEISNMLLSTRIIVNNFNEQLIGLIVENLTDTLEINHKDLINESERLSGSSFIKSYLIENDKTIKIIDVKKIFDYIYNFK